MGGHSSRRYFFANFSRALRAVSSNGFSTSVFARFIHQQIENDVDARGFLAEFRDAAGRGMNAHQQIVERKISVDRDDDFAVQNELFALSRRERADEFRKIARERLAGF